MFKHLTIALSLLCCAATAQAATREEQLNAALAIFRNYGPSGEFSRAHEQFALGLAGNWVAAAEAFLDPQSKTLNTEHLAKACATIQNEITADEFSFTISRSFKLADGSDARTATVYNTRGGNEYGFSSDPARYLQRLGIEDLKDEKKRQRAYGTLLWASGVAQAFRPSPDVLVITRNLGLPVFYLRCP